MGKLIFFIFAIFVSAVSILPFIFLFHSCMCRCWISVEERAAKDMFVPALLILCLIMYVSKIYTYLFLSAGRKFVYLTTTKYVYEYTSEISTLFGGTSTNKSSLYISAQVSLDFPTPCEGVLQASMQYYIFIELLNDSFWIM